MRKGIKVSDFVEIFEVGPRDGLQNESRIIPTEDKVTLVDKLSVVGFKRIEVASFVSPKWVPQMADSAEVLAGITRAKGVTYAALSPNLKGLERAIAANADEVAIFASASEGFSKANINATIAESLDRFAPVAEAAKSAGIKVRGYVSCVTDCPFDGKVAPENVLRVTNALRDLGCYEISLGDTIGKGTPDTIRAMLECVLADVPAQELAGHYHDTHGTALDNIEASVELGLRVFDASAGGVGGCPYAPGAAGNAASEEVAARLVALGFETGLDRAALQDAANFARGLRA